MTIDPLNPDTLASQMPMNRHSQPHQGIEPMSLANPGRRSYQPRLFPPSPATGVPVASAADFFCEVGRGKRLPVVTRKSVEGAWRSAGRILNSHCYFPSLAPRVVRVVFD